MLTDEEKARLRAEETFRDEVRRHLENEKPRRTLGARLWDALNSAIVLWLLSSVVVGSLTCYYEDAREDAAAARAEAARKAADEREMATRQAADDREMASRRLAAAIDLVPHLSSNEVSERAIALAILKNSPLAAEVYTTAVRLELEKPVLNEADQEQKRETAREWDSGSVAVPTRTAEKVPARIYVHVPVEADRSADVRKIEALLQPRGMVVITVPTSQRGPDQTDVRYYAIPERAELERREAQTIIDILKPQFGNIRAEPRAITEFGSVRPRHFELWFGRSN